LNPLYVLVTLTTLGHSVQVGSRLAVMLWAVHLDASPATVGVLSALFSLLNVFTSVHVGRWIDRSGARIPMLLGSAMVAVGTAVAFLWHELAALFVVGVVIGTFYNLVFISQQRLAGQYGRPEDRVKNFGLTSLAQSAAGMIGPVAAGFAIDHAGYPETFLMFTLMAAIPLSVLAFNLLEFPPKEPAKHREERKGGTLALLREPTLRRIYAVAVLTSSTWSIVIFLVPLYGTQIGLDASTIGIILGAFSVATVVIRLALPLLARHFTTWQLLIGSLVVSGLAFVPIPAVTGVVALTLLLAWIGMGLGLSGPISQAIVYDVSPPGRIGELLGLRVTMLNASHAAMPILSGAMGAAIGVGPVFWIVAASLLAGGWMIRGEWHAQRR
jgi:predicted MFS family arabinose efflux permease